VSIATVNSVIQTFAESVREKLGSDIDSITLFGSRARGDDWQGSDYDVAVVVKQRDQQVEERVLDAVVEVLDDYEALVSAHVFSLDEWASEMLTPLGRNIIKEGLPV